MDMVENGECRRELIDGNEAFNGPLISPSGQMTVSTFDSFGMEEVRIKNETPV